MLTNSEFSITVEDITLRLYINSKVEIPEEKSNDSTLLNLATHKHAYSELFVCAAGELCIETAGEPITLSAGDAVVIPANFPHHKLASSSETVWNSVAFTLHRCYSKKGCTLWKKFSPIYNRAQPYLLKKVPTLCELVQGWRSNLHFNPTMLPALRFITVLAELINDGHFQDEKGANVSVLAPLLDRTSKLEIILENHFAENITVDEVATRLFISPRQLSRIIKNQYGTTFHKVILEKRLNAAAHLLCTTTDSVEQIAWKVGASNLSGFYKAFAEYYRLTPSEYRAKNYSASLYPQSTTNTIK